MMDDDFGIEEIEYEKAQGIKRQLEELFDSEGWKFVEHFLTVRADAREKELINSMPVSVESMVQYARIKGSLEEARLIPEMIKQVYADIDHTLKQMLREEEAANEAQEKDHDNG